MAIGRFAVAEQGAPRIGIEHVQSRAGIDTLGFRVPHTEPGGRRYVEQAVEIPSPALK